MICWCINGRFRKLVSWISNRMFCFFRQRSFHQSILIQCQQYLRRLESPSLWFNSVYWSWSCSVSQQRWLIWHIVLFCASRNGETTCFSSIIWIRPLCCLCGFFSSMHLTWHRQHFQCQTHTGVDTKEDCQENSIIIMGIDEREEKRRSAFIIDNPMPFASLNVKETQQDALRSLIKWRLLSLSLSANDQIKSIWQILIDSYWKRWHLTYADRIAIHRNTRKCDSEQFVFASLIDRESICCREECHVSTKNRYFRSMLY